MTKRKETDVQFEFCEVCRLNHDNGRRHRFFPSHTRALSALLSRFLSRVSPLLSAIRRHAGSSNADGYQLDRLRCPFCDASSSVVCGSGNVIGHLASQEHLKNLKHFMWKHGGGGMDKVDSFCVTESELIKWKNSGSSLESAAASTKEQIGPSPKPTKDIQFNHSSKNMDCFTANSFQFSNSNVSQTVVPLQSLTNEGYQVCLSDDTQIVTAGVFPSVSAPILDGMQGSAYIPGAHTFYPLGNAASGYQTVHVGDNVPKHRIYSMDRELPAGNHCFGNLCHTTDAAWTMALLNPTQIASPSQGIQGNVKSGAPPPWLEMNEVMVGDIMNKKPNMDGLAVPSQKGMLQKLNPKRVGAAWADKRRAELELEMSGKRVAKDCDANWLPNFGRVWQAGTRKESRKEFELEKQNFIKEDNQPELPLKIQPYISKRMRTGS